MIAAVDPSTCWAPRELWISEPIQIHSSGTPAPIVAAAAISTTNRPSARARSIFDRRCSGMREGSGAPRGETSPRCPIAKPRPPLPDGPVSGRRPGPLGPGGGASARRARRDGDRGRFRLARRARKGCGEPASKSSWMVTESDCSSGRAAWSRAPASRARRRRSSAARERGAAGDRRARARLAAAAEPLRRGHRHERQDHGRPSCSATSGGPPASRSRSPATSARRSPRWSARSTPRPRSSARRRASSSRTPTRFAPECAVLLNVAPDHLDRHGDLDAYRDAKLRVFANQGDGRRRDLQRRRPRRSRAVETRRRARPRDSTSRAARVGRRTRRLALPGPHNAENAAAAAVAAAAMGIDRRARSRAGLRDLPGVPHRLERVARDRRRPLRQRLEGHQRRRRRRGAALLRRRRPRDPRRLAQGRAFDGLARAGRRALHAPAT